MLRIGKDKSHHGQRFPDRSDLRGMQGFGSNRAVRSPEMTAEEILYQIDSLARDVDCYSFGLPCNNDDPPIRFWSKAIELIKSYKEEE
jgi:hypothetical protein